MKRQGRSLMLPVLLVLLAGGLPTTTALLRGSTAETLWANERATALNMLNHPLQVQLATGELPLGSFQRLVLDRQVLLEGLRGALKGSVGPSVMEKLAADDLGDAWLATAELTGKTIEVPGIRCHGCGEAHFVRDCPSEAEPSQAVRATRSLLLQQGGCAGAAAVLRGYGWACQRLLDAGLADGGCYRGWIEWHGDVFLKVASEVDPLLEGSTSAGPAYNACLSMLFNQIDSEASVAGLTDAGSTLVECRRRLDELEPGFLAQQDRNRAFVAALTGAAPAAADPTATAASKAKAYLAKKRQREQQGKGKSGAKSTPLTS